MTNHRPASQALALGLGSFVRFVRVLLYRTRTTKYRIYTTERHDPRELKASYRDPDPCFPPPPRPRPSQGSSAEAPVAKVLSDPASGLQAHVPRSRSKEAVMFEGPARAPARCPCPRSLAFLKLGIGKNLFGLMHCLFVCPSFALCIMFVHGAFSSNAESPL